MKNCVIGLDFGTDSVRALIVDTLTGEELSSQVAWYPRWMQGQFCDPVKNQYRQHPLDYLEAMTKVIKEAVKAAPEGTADRIAGLSFDTTGSTPVLVDTDGTPLALRPEFATNPNAMFILWKDHTAVEEAAEINRLAASWETNYTRYEGGIYSSEWVWAKVLHVLRQDSAVRDAAWSWIEHCDWIPAMLTGKTRPEEVIRSRCAAGHKAMWHNEFGGLPPEAFFTALDPLLTAYRSRLYDKTYTADHKVGELTPEWCQALGLNGPVAVGAGAFDCHMGAVGGGIKPYSLVRVMGTSTCDILVAPYADLENKLVKGICGQVDGSVVPGMIGLEAGQSAFGDVYDWFRDLLSWPAHELGIAVDDFSDRILPLLSDAASQLPDDDSIPLANDWFNGRRTPDADQRLKSTITGLTLGTTAPALYKALVEATAFGSKAIADRFIQEGVPIREVIAIGGVARKSPFVMQVLANVMNMEIRVSSSDQACALGAAMFAATVSGLFPTVEAAMNALQSGYDCTYYPQEEKVEYYKAKFSEYLKFPANK